MRQEKCTFRDAQYYDSDVWLNTALFSSINLEPARLAMPDTHRLRCSRESTDDEDMCAQLRRSEVTHGRPLTDTSTKLFRWTLVSKMINTQGENNSFVQYMIEKGG